MKCKKCDNIILLKSGFQNISSGKYQKYYCKKCKIYTIDTTKIKDSFEKINADTIKQMEGQVLKEDGFYRINDDFFNSDKNK